MSAFEKNDLWFSSKQRGKGLAFHSAGEQAVPPRALEGGLEEDSEGRGGGLFRGLDIGRLAGRVCGKSAGNWKDLGLGGDEQGAGLAELEEPRIFEFCDFLRKSIELSDRRLRVAMPEVSDRHKQDIRDAGVEFPFFDFDKGLFDSKAGVSAVAFSCSGTGRRTRAASLSEENRKVQQQVFGSRARVERNQQLKHLSPGQGTRGRVLQHVLLGQPPDVNRHSSFELPVHAIRAFIARF